MAKRTKTAASGASTKAGAASAKNKKAAKSKPAKREPRPGLLIDISARLQVMRGQESAHYKVPDYLAAEWQRKLREAAEGRDEDCVARAAAQANPSAQAASDPPSSGAGGDGAPSNNANSNQGAAPSASGNTQSTQINEVWREKICEWCYQVVDHFDFHREVVAVAVSCLDRYLATRAVNRRIFQLAAMTALYLAIKLYEPGKLRMASLIELSRGYFLAEHIVTMEDSMLQSLGWHVHPPTSFAFVRDLVRLLPEDVAPAARHDVAELARFLTELSVCDYGLATKRPSSVALACIVNAVELQGSRRVRPDHKDEVS